MNLIKKHWKLLVFLVFTALLVVGVVRLRAQKNKETFTIINPKIQNLEKVLEVTGTVDAKERASLRFLAGGKVTYLGAFEGDHVKKWQTIASIDKRELQKTLEKELNTYSSTRVDFDQTKDDAKDIHGNKKTDRTLEKNELTLDNAVLTVELKDLALKNASLYSPIEGVLISSPAKTSGVILSSTDVFEVVNPNSLYFDAEVDEADIALIRQGLEVQLDLDAFPEEKIPLRIDSVSFNSSETENGTVFKVRMYMPSANDLLKYRLGMNGTARILIQRKENVLTLPVTALITREDKTFVEVLDAKNNVIQKEVQLGIETDNDSEVTSGLQESDKVVQR